jgi:DNA polymerase-3 subunit gamma/tau
MGTLHRLWQLLLKGLADVRSAPHPMQAAEMALLRLIHASDLPDPAELLRAMAQAPDAAAVPPASSAAPAPAPAPHAALPADFEGIVALFQAHTEPALAHQLSDELRLIDYAPQETPPRLVLAVSPGARREPLAAIGRLLSGWTGTEWRVELRSEGGGPTLHEGQKAAAKSRNESARADPLVDALLARFPDAELIGVDTPAERTPNAQSR